MLADMPAASSAILCHRDILVVIRFSFVRHPASGWQLGWAETHPAGNA
jgi:hypothetical protein